MRSAQRSARAHRQHPQRPTRRVVARHRSADLPGQADGSHKPRAAYAAHCTEKKSERQRAPPSAPSAPRTRKSPPQCAAHSSAPAPPSEHTHIESTCRRSRRTPQVQFSLSTPHESSVAGQPATASGVAIIYVYLGAPGMSPTPRSAKYPATHSLPPPPGWRKCSPLVIVSADSGGQTLRCANRASACNPERQRGGRHYTVHGASVNKQSRGLGVLRDLRLRQLCAASASRTKCSHTATMFLGAYLWHAFLIYCTDPGTTS